MAFGAWRPLVGASAPDSPGLLQARLGDGSDGLIPYPTGTSAMVYYDGGDRLADALIRLRERAPVDEHARVRVRFSSVTAPSEKLAALLRQFEDRFGAPPRWNAR